MFAALFLAPELFHFYGETNFFRWAAEIGDFFKVVSHLQEYCGSAAFWAGFIHVRFPSALPPFGSQPRSGTWKDKVAVVRA